MRHKLAAVLVTLVTLVGFSVAAPGVAEAQSCSWQNFWTQGGSMGSSWNISYSTCPDGSHQIVGDYHYYGVLRQDMGGFNYWVVWSIGMPGYTPGNYWEGKPADLFFCANGGGMNGQCWDHELYNRDNAPTGWAEYWTSGGIQYSNAYGVSDEWGGAINLGSYPVHAGKAAVTRLW